MERKQFVDQVGLLRAGGKSIRAIALELDVHRSKVERALKTLRRAKTDEPGVSLDHSRPLDRMRGEAFIGHQREMGELQAALNDALAGAGSLVMLVGEPGIGKTRTAQELAAIAERGGFRVLWGRCYEGGGAPPYWPWLQVLRALIRQADAAVLRAQVGPGGADIAEVLPELADKLPGLHPPPSLEPEQSRFRLFESITIFLKTAGQSQPLMLVLDDLHWVDTSSLLLLEFLAGEMAFSRLLVLGSYRDVEVSRRHPLSETLGRLVRQPCFSRLPLSGLAQEEVAHLLEIVSGTRPLPATAASVHQRTQGNPLFVTQVARLMSHQGGEWSGALPQVVRDAIGERLGRLTEGCRGALAIASVMGREFDFPVLARVTARPDEELLETIEEALEAHVLEEAGGGRVERYQFVHALIQQTLYEGLSSSRRVRLHAQIGEALEGIYAGNIEAHVGELAYHFGEAAPVLGSEKMVQYSLLAGEGALDAYAYEDALVHFQRGLEAKGVPLTGVEAARDSESASLLFGLGRAQAATLERHRMQEVMAILNRALDYYAETGGVDQAVAIAEYPFYPLIGQRTGNAQLIARALALASPESHAAGRLLSRHARVIGIEEGNYSSARETFARALSIAQLKGDVALEARILADAANVDMLFWHHQESLEKNQQAMELTRRVDEPHAEVLTCYTSVLNRLALGDLSGMRLQASAVLSIAEKLRDRFWLTMALRANEDVAHVVGDWQTARGLSNRGLEMSPTECRNLCTRALLEYQAGDFAQGGTYLKRLVEVMRLTPPGATNQHAFTAMAIPLVTRISGLGDLLEVAEGAAEIVLSSPSRTGHMDLFARVGLALLAVTRKDAAVVQGQYGSLEPYRGIMIPFVMLAADRLLGLLARTMGDLDQAMAHCEDALAFCRKAGCRPELAWSLCDYSDTLLVRNQRDDRARVLVLLEESLAISTELAMKPLMERVAALLEQLAAQPGPAPVYPHHLTHREVEVLRLVASGRTGAEIAARLVLSRRTVERHISNIYNKTNTHSRSEATAFAFTHGLMPPA